MRRRAALIHTLRSRIQRFRDAEYRHSTVCGTYCDDFVLEKLDETLELLSRGPKSGVKPQIIRKMVHDLYEHRMDSHQVIQNCANRYVYVPPLCIRLLEDLDIDVGRELNRVNGMILGRYKGDVKRKVDWIGSNAGLDAKALWPYGQHHESSL